MFLARPCEWSGILLQHFEPLTSIRCLHRRQNGVNKKSADSQESAVFWLCAIVRVRVPLSSFIFYMKVHSMKKKSKVKGGQRKSFWKGKQVVIGVVGIL